MTAQKGKTYSLWKGLQLLAFPFFLLFVVLANSLNFLKSHHHEAAQIVTNASKTDFLSHLIPWLCPFRTLTGYLCPGCGLTHSFMALIQGHLLESFNYHPLGPLIHSLLIFMLFDYSFLNFKNTRALYRAMNTSTFFCTFLLVSLISWNLLRNLVFFK